MKNGMNSGSYKEQYQVSSSNNAKKSIIKVNISIFIIFLIGLLEEKEDFYLQLRR
jgi:hypothetical protein